MQAGLDVTDNDFLRGALEALLFVSDEPVSSQVLARAVGCPREDVDLALSELATEFAVGRRGIVLDRVAGGWRLATSPRYHDVIGEYAQMSDNRRLSRAAMETLAIIAYSQPTTRVFVSSVRGVNSDSTINSLLEKGLIREDGVADSPGNPILYSTTQVFLEQMDLNSLDDLPELSDFAPDAETEQAIRERLSAQQAGPGSTDEMPLFDADDYDAGNTATDDGAGADIKIPEPM